MKLYKFKSYDEYVRIQQEANRRKIHRLWISEHEVEMVTGYIREHLPDTRFGICHGVRNGWEVRRFREALGVEVIGTDISETATQFENVIQWDFHDVKPEWVGSVDFIYSNALDHSCDPDRCVAQWMSTIRPEGRCFIEWSDIDGPLGFSPSDCFAANYEEYCALIRKYGEIETVLEADVGWRKRLMLIRRRVVFVIRPNGQARP